MATSTLGSPGSLDDLVARIDAQVAAVGAAPGAPRFATEPAASSRSVSRRHVAISVAGLHCAVPIENVVETGYAPGWTFVPHVPPWVAGVTNLRGDVLAVIDLRHLLGFEPLERRGAARLLVARSTGFEVQAGFLVDGLHGAFAVADEWIRHGGPSLDPRIAGLARGTVEREDKLIALLDLDALFELPAMRRLRAG